MRGGGSKLVRGRRDPLSVLKGTDIEGLDLLPADFSYRHLDITLDQSKKPLKGVARVLEPLAEHYDVAILDCAPSISLVSENVFTAADALIVPLVPSTLSVRTCEQLQTFLAGGAAAGADVVAFLSIVDAGGDCIELAESLSETLPGVARRDPGRQRRGAEQPIGGGGAGGREEERGGGRRRQHRPHDEGGDAFLGTTSGVLRLHEGALEPLGLDGHSVTALHASDDALLAGPTATGCSAAPTAGGAGSASRRGSPRRRSAS